MPIARPHVRTLDPDARITHVRDWLAIGVQASVGVVLLLAVFLAARRLVGAMSAPLTALPLLATAAVLLIWVWCVRIAFRAPGDRRGPTSGSANNWSAGEYFTEWAPFVSLVLVTFACSYPGGRFIDWLIWLPTFAAAWYSPPRLLFRHERTSPTLRIHPSLPQTPPATSEANELVVQQLTRFRTADGQDAIRGTLMAEFAAGQRTATLYVSFCPPFRQLPEVEIELADADADAVELIQVLHNGAQLEVRLLRPATHANAVVVEFFAAGPASA